MKGDIIVMRVKAHDHSQSSSSQISRHRSPLLKAQPARVTEDIDNNCWKMGIESHVCCSLGNVDQGMFIVILVFFFEMM